MSRCLNIWRVVTIRRCVWQTSTIPGSHSWKSQGILLVPDRSPHSRGLIRVFHWSTDYRTVDAGYPIRRNGTLPPHGRHLRTVLYCALLYWHKSFFLRERRELSSTRLVLYRLRSRGGSVTACGMPPTKEPSFCLTGSAPCRLDPTHTQYVYISRSSGNDSVVSTMRTVLSCVPAVSCTMPKASVATKQSCSKTLFPNHSFLFSCGVASSYFMSFFLAWFVFVPPLIH